MMALRLLVAAFAVSGAAGAEGQSGKTRQSGDVLTLGNDAVEVRFDRTKGTFTASSGGATFIRCGRLRSTTGKASIVGIKGALGTGRGVRLEYERGDADVVAVYPGLPFVCVNASLGNRTTNVRTVEAESPGTFTVDLGKPAGALRVLGCDGLTPADAQRTSYTFLALAEPNTRAGVVAGWLTQDRGSGIVRSEPGPAGVRIEGLTEYGKLRVPAGETVKGEIFAIGRFDDALAGLEAYADAIAQVNQIGRQKRIPSGYCTWYSSPHGGASHEKHMAELAGFCKTHLTTFGLGVLQIDHGWQIVDRDYTTHRPDGPYRSGMKAVADKIHAAGMTPGIWFIPCGWDHKRPVFADHQDWFVKRADGKPYEVEWAGTCLDMTHPEARSFLHDVVARMTREWGCKYIKIDGLWSGMAVKLLYPEPNYRNDNLGDAVFHDPSKTNVEAYRDGLKLVREAAGDDVYILGCCIAQNMRTLGASIGLVDAMRIGRDIGADWRHILHSIDMGSRLYFLHRRVWANDPDCLMVREPMTLAQARAWGSWIALTGQLNIVSEWLPGLPADRLEIVKRTMPNHGGCARPVDLFERPVPRVWHLAVGEGAARRDVIGLFNWDLDKPDSLRLDLDRLDLPGGGGTYVGFDYWANTFIPPFSGALAADVAPSSCRIIAIRPMSDRPQLLSTSRHITQGVVDVVDETWDPASGKLTGVSRLVGGDPYELRIVVPLQPTSWRAASVSAGDKWAEVSVSVEQPGPCVRATLTSARSRRVRWTVRFDRGPASDASPAPPVSGLSAKVAPFGKRVELTWDRSEAFAYRVTRDGGRTFTQPSNRFVDKDVVPGQTHTYSVRSVGWSGVDSTAAEIKVVVPKPKLPPVPPRPDVHLSDLKAIRATVGWGKLGVNKSVEGRPLTVNGKTYAKGMGVHANSELVYGSRRHYKRFVAVAGLDHEMRKDDRCSVVFQVHADGKLLAESPVLSWSTIDHWHFDLPVPAGCKRVRLFVTDAGDGNYADHADWVDAGFVTKE